MPRKDIAARDCVQCGIPYRHGNPAYKTCGSPRCVKQQRLDGYKKANADAKERRKAMPRDPVPKRRMRPRDTVIISDEAGRRKVIDSVRGEMDKGFFESVAVTHAAERLGEKPAVVLSIWRSRQR